MIEIINEVKPLKSDKLLDKNKKRRVANKKMLCEWCGYIDDYELIESKQHDLCPCCGMDCVDVVRG
jgi:rubrerythrin